MRILVHAIVAAAVPSSLAHGSCQATHPRRVRSPRRRARHRPAVPQSRRSAFRPTHPRRSHGRRRYSVDPMFSAWIGYSFSSNSNDGRGKGSTGVAGSCQGRLPWSSAGGRLPKFYLVSFWIDDPAKLSVHGIVDLLENVAPFFAQGFDQGVDIFHPVIDHERCSAGRKLVALRRTNGPGGCSGNRLTFTVGPVESRATPFLNIDSEVPLVPGL